MNRQEFDQIFASVSNWDRWGQDDQRGTLNLITPAHVSASVYRRTEAGESTWLAATARNENVG